MMILVSALLLLLLRPADGWNIGGHSPVDPSDKRLVAAAKFALGPGGADKLGMGELELGDAACSCRGCGCILSATRQVVAGVNWDMTLRIVPKDEGAPDQYRKVTVFDETFKGGDDKYTLSKSEAIDAKTAQSHQRQFTQAAVDSMTDPSVGRTSNLRSTTVESGSDASTASYMDKITSRMGNLVTTVNEQGDCEQGKVVAGDKVSMHYTALWPRMEANSIVATTAASHSTSL